MNTIALRLNRMNVAGLIQFARNVHTKMRENAMLFANPPVTMERLKDGIDALETANLATFGGGTQATLARQPWIDKVENDLSQLALYVAQVANGDSLVIAQAGMTPKGRGPRRYDTLTTPSALIADVVGTGKISLRWRGTHNAKAYTIECCADPVAEEGWKISAFVSATSAVIEGLMPGNKYWFRVQAIGSKNLKSDWSDPVGKAVL